ncbi:MAG: complex I subunit 1 family protein [Candidatus Hodarchaeota archaeon]
MNPNDSILKSFTYFMICTLIIASLYFIFQGSHIIITFLKYFLFPGILFIFTGALFYNWFDRKVYAKMQNRKGPRLMQPVYDALKLLIKEDITPNGVDIPEFSSIPPIQLILALLIAFFTPIYIAEGLISFEGDLVFLLFLLAILSGSIFLLGWSSNNPYGLLGGSRAAIAELSLEIPLTIAFIGPAILAGSLRLSNIVQSEFNLIDIPLNVIYQINGFDIRHLLYIIPLSILFYIAVLSTNAVLEKIPFDPAHAEVEIVGGWTVELSGKKLLFIRLANLITEFALAGIIAAVFLGGPGFWPLNSMFKGILMVGQWDISYYIINFITFIIKITLIIFLITISRTVLSRLRIDQLVQYFWRFYLPISFLTLLMIIYLVGVL